MSVADMMPRTFFLDRVLPLAPSQGGGINLAQLIFLIKKSAPLWTSTPLSPRGWWFASPTASFWRACKSKAEGLKMRVQSLI